MAREDGFPADREPILQTIDWHWSSARWYAAEGQLQEESLPRLTNLPAGFFVGAADYTPH